MFLFLCPIGPVEPFLLSLRHFMVNIGHIMDIREMTAGILGPQIRSDEDVDRERGQSTFQLKGSRQKPSTTEIRQSLILLFTNE